MSTPTFAQDLAALMAAWDAVMAAARAEFPNATAEEQYQIAFGCMRQRLGF